MSDTKDLSELEALLSEGSFDKLFTLGPSFASGAFSTIHRATKKHAEEDEEKEYVVKVVQTKFADEIREVTREVRCLREVAHANLVEFGGCWLFEKQVYLVLENCHIGSLASIYEETDMGFDDEFIKFMAREILRGLAYLHSKQIVHRDLKCANVLMNEDGEIKIADLGTVGRLDAGKKRFSLVGTPHWMSPEVCKNNIMPNAYGTAADIWALGITCIEAAELDPPHGEEDEVLNIIATTKAPPTFADPSCRMKELQEFVAECLTVSPAERKTASELLLHHFFDEVDEDAGMVMAMDVIDRREKTAKLKPPTPVVHIEVEDKTETTTQPEEPKSVTTIAPIPEQSTHDASADPDEGTLSTASSVSSVRAAKESTDQLHDKEPVRKRDSASSGNTPSERHTSSDPSAPPVAVTASETKKDDKVKTRGRRTSSLTGKAKDKKKGKGSQEEPAPAPRDDKKESARIKLAKKETKAAQRKKLMTPLALDKLPVMTDTGSNSGKATTPKIGAATPRARARLGNVTTRKATDNLPPEAQPFACILENRKDNNKAYEKDNKLLRDLTALQTKQRKAAEKQTKPLKDIVDDIKAELASIESEIEKKYAELKSASDVEYDKKTIENNAYKLETEQSIEKEFAAATAELEQKFASDKEAAAGDEAALLDVQLKHCDASLDLTLNHFTKQQDCALEMLDRIHAASYPYNLATQELRLKQHEETNLSERLQATRAKLREATKSLAQAHQSLARDNLKEKHKLTNVQESIKIAKKVLKDAFEKQVEVLEEKHNARLKQLKEQHKDDKKVQKTEMAAELSRYKKTIKDGEIWFTEYLLTVGEKTSQSIASNQQMELELLATALEEAAVLEQKEFDAVEEAKREKYKSAHEQMTKILLLKQVDGKFQHELSIINCNEAFEIKKITAEFDNRKKKDEIELAYVQAHLSDEKLKEEMSEKEAEIKKSMDAWQDDLDEEIGITEENAEGDRNNLKFVKYPTVGMTKLGVKVGDCETLAKKVEVEANK